MTCVAIFTAESNGFLFLFITAGRSAIYSTD